MARGGPMDPVASLLAIPLSLAPGAWLAFGLGSPTWPFGLRLALAATLSPLSVGLTVWALCGAGLPFDAAAATAAWLSAPALWLAWRARPQRVAVAEWLMPIAALVALAACMIALWSAVPGFRFYSWHNMMQAEAVYQVLRLPRLPEEMSLAGVRLNYAWFGHIHIAAIARLAEASPLAVFPAANLVALAAFVWLMFETCRALTPGRDVLVFLVVAVLLLTPNLAGVALHYVDVLGGAGDIRTSTPLHKFLHFDLMTAGLGLLAATAALALRRLDAPSWGPDALLVTALCAVTLIYPLLAPASLALTGALLIARPLAALWRGDAIRIAGADIRMAAALVIPLTCGALYLRVLSDGGAAHLEVAVAEPWEMRRRLLDGVLRAGVVWSPLLLGAAWRLWRSRDGVRLGLFTAAGALTALYLALELPLQVQYKFLVAALLCALPLASEQATLWIEKLGRWAAPAAGALFALTLVFVAPHIVQQHIPWQVGDAPLMDERRLAVAEPTRGSFGWTDVVRTETPLDAVLVRPPMDVPAEVLTQRSAYLALGVSQRRPGYGMLTAEMLIAVKGYPTSLIAHRESLVRACYGAEDQSACASVLQDIAALGRAAVVYALRGGAMERLVEGRGELLYAGDDAGVWLLDAP